MKLRNELPGGFWRLRYQARCGAKFFTYGGLLEHCNEHGCGRRRVSALSSEPQREAGKMSARDVIAEFIAREVGFYDDGMLGQADDLVETLEEAGYRITPASSEPQREERGDG